MKSPKINFAGIMILALFILSSLFFECKSSDSVKDKKDSNGVTEKKKKQFSSYNRFFPVGNNMVWDYINEGPREETELFHVAINDFSDNGDAASAVFDSFPFFTKQIEKANLTVSKTGSVYVTDSNGKKNLLLPEESKLQKGYRWKYGDWDAGIEDTGVTVKTDSETIDNCIYAHYGLGGITFSVQLWLAKDRGIVKWGSFRTNPPTLVFTYYVLK
jgi:hypothetical protein